jgi:6-phosphogluconolactonase
MVQFATKLLFFAACSIRADAFVPILSTKSAQISLRLAPAEKVYILPTEEEVTSSVHSIVSNAAKSAIATRGHFALAIPGGSVLKVLTTLEPEWDVSKMTLAFVNHKCVPIDDVKTAIEAQARTKFLDRWGVDNIISLGGSADGEKEANDYEAKLKSLGEDILPRDEDGFPVFDLALVGVGDDGHIGSLYPNRGEIDVVDGPWVVPAFQKDPPSISLTLPVMQRAKQTVISAAGKSEKYPNGKADAMRLATVEENVTPKDFPASALRDAAFWILDEPNGSETGMPLSDEKVLLSHVLTDMFEKNGMM